MDDRRAALRLKLVAVAMLGVCPAAVAIGVVGVVQLRSYLNRQADVELRGYATDLVGDSFVIGPVFGGPKPGPPVTDGLSVEIVDPGGKKLARTGAGTSGVPVSGAWIASHIGKIATVNAPDGQGSWRVVVESIRYSAHRIPYTYGAEDAAIVVSARTLPGLPGVVVVGMDLAGIAATVDKFAYTDLAVSAAALLLLAWAGAWFVRRGGGRRPARSPPAPWLAQAVIDTGEEFQRSLRLIRGVSDYYRSGRQLRPAELDRMVERLEAEAGRLAAAAQTLRQAADPDPTGPPRSWRRLTPWARTSKTD
jgi:hypothetical protein